MTSKRSSKAAEVEDYSDFVLPGEVEGSPAPTPALPGSVPLPPQQLIPVPGGVQLPDGTFVPLPGPVEAAQGAPARGLASEDTSFDDVNFDDTDFEPPAAPPKRLGMMGQLARDMAPWVRDEKTPEEFKNMAQDRLGGAVQALTRPLTAGTNLVGAGIADAYRAQGRALSSPFTKNENFKQLSADDWAAAREGEGKGFGTYMKEDGAPAWAHVPVGIAVDTIGDPSTPFAGGMTKLARLGKFGKTVQGLEEFLSASGAMKKAGKGIYGAPLSGARRNMAKYKDASDKTFEEFVENLMNDGVGAGAKSNAEFLEQIQGARKGAWNKLAEKIGLGNKQLKVDLAPHLDAALTVVGGTRDSVGEVFRTGTLTEKKKMLNALKVASPRFKPLLEKLENQMVGQNAKATQDFLAGLGEDLARGPIDLDLHHDLKQTYGQKAYGAEAMKQNAATTNFRGNNTPVRNQKAALAFGDVVDDMLDEEAMKIAQQQAAAKGMSVDLDALKATQKAKRAAVDEGSRQYGIMSRGYAGVANDVPRYEASNTITAIDALLGIGAGAEVAMSHDPKHAAIAAAGIAGKKGLMKLLRDPKTAAKAGLKLRNAGKSTVWDAVARGALTRQAADALTETEDKKPDEEF